MRLLGLTGGVVVALGWLTLITLAGFMPLMALSAMRSLKGIRRELERLNATMERNAIVEGDRRPYVKTGSLNIR